MSGSHSYEAFLSICEIWSRVFLFHHNTASAETAERWVCALVEAIAKLEDEGEHVDPLRLINSELLGPLNDPLCFARPPEASLPNIPPCPPSETWSGCTYLPLRLSDDAMQRALSLDASGNRELAIVDFRFLETDVSPARLDELFHPFCDVEACSKPPEHRGHRGWAESGSDGPYRAQFTRSPTFQRMLESRHASEAARSLRPSTFPNLVALVNDRVCLLLSEHLAVFQACGGRVIWERQGEFEIPRDRQSIQSPWFEAYVSAPASPWSPDLTLDQLPRTGELADLARSVIHKRSSSATGRVRAIEREKHSTTTEKRAKRIAGWIKTCTIWRYLYPLAPTSQAYWEEKLRKGQRLATSDLSDMDHYDSLARICRDIADGHLHFVPPSPNEIGEPIEDAPIVPHHVPGARSEQPVYKSGDIGWLQPFRLESGREVKEALQHLDDCSGLIVDLRDYPWETGIRGALVEGLCSTPFNSGVYEIPLALNPKEPQQEFSKLQFRVDSSDSVPYSGPVVALIDETVVSAAEDICLYLLESRRVTFVGRNTAGCLGNVTHIQLPDGARVSFSGMRVADSHGRLLSKHGIVPHVVVKETMAKNSDSVAVAGREVLEDLLNETESSEWPFSDLVRHAKHDLCLSAGHLWKQLPLTARTDLESHLESRLSKIAAPTLEKRLEARNAVRLPSIFSIPPESSDHAVGNPEYQSGSDSAESLFNDYPVLEELLKGECIRWASTTSELLERWSADKRDVESKLFNGKNLGPIAGVAPGFSDPHNGGRTVTILEFGSGEKAVYKPKSLELDDAFARLLDWCNAKGLSLELRIPSMLARDGYGWMEFLTQQPPASPSDRREYLRQAGMLLALVHLLEASDLHVENVIAVGSHPVLVDLEGLLQHRLADSDPIYLLRPRRFCGSVLRTKLLPGWNPDSRGGWWFDPGIVGPMPEQSGDFGRDYVQDFVSGFEEASTLLLNHRDELIGDSSPLILFRDKQARVIFQDTLFYMHVLQRSIYPRCLRSSSARQEALEIVGRPLSMSRRQERHGPRFEAEKRMLEVLDIPHFSAPTTGTTLFAGAKPIMESCFEEASFDRALQNLRQIDSESLQNEVELIRRSLTYERPGGFRVELPTDEHPEHDVSNLEAPPVTDEELLMEAEAIGDKLYSSAIRSSEGVMWPAETLLSAANGDVLGIQPCDAFLYSGTSGIAAFLAALARETDNPKYRELALEAIAPLCRLFQDRLALEHVVRLHGIGIGEGLGSLVYGMVRIAGFTEEYEVLDLASAAVEILSRKGVDAGQPIDLIGGTSGAIQAILALEEIRATGECIETAVALGRAALDEASITGQDPEGSENADPGSGFAHGLAGIGYTLLRLGAASNDSALLDLGQAATAAEDRYYSPEAKNWMIVGSTKQQPVYQWSYCHGAPGIGLGRLASLSFVDRREIRIAIDNAVDSTLTMPASRIDHLCCGQGGRIEFVLTAAEVLDDERLRIEARAMVSKLVQARRATGYLRLIEGRTSDQLVPGFFRGLAGVGYLMLRTIHPRSMPNILLFQ